VGPPSYRLQRDISWKLKAHTCAAVPPWPFGAALSAILVSLITISCTPHHIQADWYHAYAGTRAGCNSRTAIHAEGRLILPLSRRGSRHFAVMAYNPETMSFEVSENDVDMVYVSGLPREVTEAEIAEHFGSIGVVKFDKKKNAHKVRNSCKARVLTQIHVNRCRGRMLLTEVTVAAVSTTSHGLLLHQDLRHERPLLLDCRCGFTGTRPRERSRATAPSPMRTPFRRHPQCPGSVAGSSKVSVVVGGFRERCWNDSRISEGT